MESPVSQPQLSVVIPTYNEENFILEALKSVAFADEIILIDSFSTDRTLEIAAPYCHKIIKRTFDNFSNQKNEALLHATGDWILFLDADERISAELQIKILKAINTNKFEAYKLTFVHYYMDRFLYHHTDKVLRLVKNDDLKFTGKVHEQLKLKGEVGLLKEPVYHYTYRDFSTYLNKKSYYATFQAQQYVTKGKKIGLTKLWIKPYYRYIKSAYLKGSAKDGIPGIVVAKINGYGVFLRLVKTLIIAQELQGVPYTSLDAFDDHLKLLTIDSIERSKGLNIQGFNGAVARSRKVFFRDYLIEGNLWRGKEGFINSYLKGHLEFITIIRKWLSIHGLN